MVSSASKIYVTHCSRAKNDSLQGTGKKVRPDVLYRSTRIRSFMRHCEERVVRWAIFSDHYGVWFSHEEREWYGDDVGDPDRVTEEKFRELVGNFDDKLAGYDQICFYHHPTRFHRLYKRLLKETKLRDRIVFITSVYQID